MGGQAMGMIEWGSVIAGVTAGFGLLLLIERYRRGIVTQATTAVAEQIARHDERLKAMADDIQELRKSVEQIATSIRLPYGGSE